MMPMVPRVVLSCFALLALAFTVGCAGEATPTRQDATAVDRGPAEDLTAADHAMDDADDDRVTEEDAAVDAAVGAVDVPSPWGDAPLVDLGGYLIPVDPHAVPPPGSECVGDGGVRAGDPAIEPPRPIRPLSVSRVTSQRPTFQWVLPAGTTGARVEVCADRCCTRVLQTIDAEGTTVRPTVALPAGVVFWRMFGRRGAVVGSRTSYTWEFGVRRRDAPNDTSWGTIRDFTGDGFDDLVVLARRSVRESTFDTTTDVFLARGSVGGLQEPVRAGIALIDLPREGSVGDFNGDGIADVVWREREGEYLTVPGWVDVVQGSPDGLRRVARLQTGAIGGCASSTYPVATDWNGDGYSDIVTSVGMRCDASMPPDAAFLFVYYGSARGIAAVPQTVVQVDRMFLHPETITRVALGDVDLDGYGDVFLTSHFVGAGTTGVYAEHFVAYGPDLATLRRNRVAGPGISDNAWEYPLGDVDGDGHVDWSLQVRLNTRLYVYRYAGGLSSPSETLRDNGARYSGGHFIPANDGADVNGDGLSDVIVAAALSLDEFRFGNLPVDRGRVYVYPGTLGGLATTPSLTLRPIRTDGGEVREEFFGAGAMSPGDVNADGFDDIVMRDQLDNRLCIFHGRATGGVGVPNGCFRQLWPDHDLYL